MLFENSTPAPKPTTLETAKNNIGFILVCIGVFAGLFIIAAFTEKLLFKNKKRIGGTRYLTLTAMLSCMAAVLMLLEFPLAFLVPGFYKLDFSEVPVMICTFYLGPSAGVLCELIKVILKILLKGTSTAFVGDFANFVVGCTFVLPASIIYHTRRSNKSAIIGLVAGTLIMTVFGSLFNALYLIPKFAQLFHMPLETIVNMGTAINKHITSVPTLALFAVAPFNLLKGVIVSVLTFLLYKALLKVIRIDKPEKALN